jgi:hypothetical protein
MKKIEPISFKSPYPWVGHLPFAAWLMKEVKPKIFVELGTHYGNSYFMFCQTAQEESIDVKCYAVDTWQGEEHAGHYSEDVYDYVERHNQNNYKNFSKLLRMTFDEAVDEFENESIDILHIDGLHTYEAVKHDFETWLPKVKPSGIILFHDINVKRDDFGVWRLWEELKADYKFTLEFSHSNGLGVLQPSNIKTQDWLSENKKDQAELISFFERSGELFELRAKLNEKSQEVNEHIIDIYAYQERLRLKEAEIKAYIEDIYAYKDKLLKLQVENSHLDQLLIDARKMIATLESELKSTSIKSIIKKIFQIKK